MASQLERLRQQAIQVLERPTPAPPPSDPPSTPPPVPTYDSLNVWWATFPAQGWINMALVVGMTNGLMTAVFLVLLLFGSDPATWENGGLDIFHSCAAITSVCLVVAIYAWLDRLHYREWKSRLPNPVEGWDALVLRDNLDSSHWLPMRLDVELTAPDTATQQAVMAALVIFQDQQNRRTYRSETNSGSLEPVGPEWQLGELAMIGQVNTIQIRALKRLLTRELALIQRTTGYVHKVQIAVTGTLKYRSRFTGSSD